MQAAHFNAVVEKLRHPIVPPPPPPAGSVAARVLAAVTPKPTSPILGRAGVIEPLKPCSAAWRWMQAVKKARGGI